MNAFRLLFLLAVITAASLLALTRRAPMVFEENIENSLLYQAESDARVLAQVEDAAAAQRLDLAMWLASSPGLVEAFRPLAPPAEDGTPAPAVTPPGPAFNALLAEAWDRTPDNIDAIVLFDAQGQVIAPQTDRGIVRVTEFAQPAGVAEVVAEGHPRHAVFVRAGRLFASAAVPVRTTLGNVAVVVVVEEYNGATIADRRARSGVQAVYFVNRDSLGGTVAAPEYEAAIDEVIARTTASNIGEPGRFRTQSFRTVDVAAEGVESDTPPSQHLVFLAPTRLGPPSVDDLFGAVIVTDAQQPPDTLWRILAQNRAFDEGTMEVWTYLAMGLALFFGGLFLHDQSMGRSVRRLAERIGESAATGDPSPLAVRVWPSFLRPIASSFNEFLEQFRAESEARRLAEADADEARSSSSWVEPAPAGTAHQVIDRILSSADFPEVEPEPVLPPSKPPVDEPEPPTEFDSDGDSINRAAADFLAAHAPTPMGGVATDRADTRPAFEAPDHTNSDSELARRIAAGDRLDDIDEFEPFEEPDTENTIPTLSDLPDLDEIGDSFDHMHDAMSRDALMHQEGTADFETVEEQAPDDPHMSGTVPRATVAELARRAAESRAQRATSAPAEDELLSRAEARLRSLGVDPVSQDRETADPRRILFEEFVAARIETGDPPEGLTFERFAAKLEKNRRALMAKIGCSDVRFRVDVTDGKATLKATPIK